jgi:hypothetical protein
MNQLVMQKRPDRCCVPRCYCCCELPTLCGCLTVWYRRGALTTPGAYKLG